MRKLVHITRYLIFLLGMVILMAFYGEKGYAHVVPLDANLNTNEVRENALSGEYCVGQGADFANLNDAVSALCSRGVNGPVRFKLHSIQVNTPIVIPYIYGVSELNQITFEGIHGDSRILFAGGHGCNIELNGAKFVRFKNLILENRTGEVIRIENGSAYNVIQNCKLMGSCDSELLVMDGTEKGNFYNSIYHCQFLGGNQGVVLMGDSQKGNYGNALAWNQFQDQKNVSLKCQEKQNDLIVAHNQVDVAANSFCELEEDDRFVYDNQAVVTRSEKECGFEARICRNIDSERNSISLIGVDVPLIGGVCAQNNILRGTKNTCSNQATFCSVGSGFWTLSNWTANSADLMGRNVYKDVKFLTHGRSEKKYSILRAFNEGVCGGYDFEILCFNSHFSRVGDVLGSPSSVKNRESYEESRFSDWTLHHFTGYQSPEFKNERKPFKELNGFVNPKSGSLHEMYIYELFDMESDYFNGFTYVEKSICSIGNFLSGNPHILGCGYDDAFVCGESGICENLNMSISDGFDLLCLESLKYLNLSMCEYFGDLDYRTMDDDVGFESISFDGKVKNVSGISSSELGSYCCAKDLRFHCFGKREPSDEDTYVDGFISGKLSLNNLPEIVTLIQDHLSTGDDWNLFALDSRVLPPESGSSVIDDLLHRVFCLANNVSYSSGNEEISATLKTSVRSV